MVAVIASTSLRPTLPAPASGGRKWIVKAAVVVAGAGKKRKLRDVELWANPEVWR